MKGWKKCPFCKDTFSPKADPCLNRALDELIIWKALAKENKKFYEKKIKREGK